jgi:hypothetical protein
MRSPRAPHPHSSDRWEIRPYHPPQPMMIRNRTAVNRKLVILTAA